MSVTNETCDEQPSLSMASAFNESSPIAGEIVTNGTTNTGP